MIFLFQCLCSCFFTDPSQPLCHWLLILFPVCWVGLLAVRVFLLGSTLCFINFCLWIPPRFTPFLKAWRDKQFTRVCQIHTQIHSNPNQLRTVIFNLTLWPISTWPPPVKNTTYVGFLWDVSCPIMAVLIGTTTVHHPPAKSPTGETHGKMV